MAYSELIKDINRIRACIRNFYVFGFYTREENAAAFGGSARSYDNDKRRVESWMGEYLSFHQNSAGKSVFLSAAGSSILRNPLYRAFKAKSFTANDIVLHFCLMDLFAAGDTYDQSEVAELLSDAYPMIFEAEGVPDVKTIRLKLNELVQLGLLQRSENGRKSVSYRIAPVTIDLASEELRDAIHFFSEAAPLGVIGSFLQDKWEGGCTEQHCFRFRHHYLLRAIDSEILAELLLAIDERRRVKMRVDNVFQGSMQYETTPLKIYVSTEGGREYLLSWNNELQRFYFTRLDRIIWVVPAETDEEWDELVSRFAQLKNNLWGVSFGGLEKIGAALHIEMEVRAGQQERFIIRRLEREKRCGAVHPMGDDRYRFTADVFDPMELFPWICSFTGRITDLVCDDEEVIGKYREYLLQLSGASPDLPSDDTDKDADRDEEEDDSGQDPGPVILPRDKASAIKGRHDLVFHEIYGAYYNAVARILALAVRGELTPRKLMQAARDKAFAESIMYIPDHMLSGEWPFLSENMKTELKNEPVMPLTLIQKRWLKSLLEDPRIRLFLQEETLQLLQEKLNDVRPLYARDTFCRFDRFADEDAFEDPAYIDHFRTMLRAIHEELPVQVSYQNGYGGMRELIVQPETMEYSPRESKFRVYAGQIRDEQGDGESRQVLPKEPYRLNISRIRSCKILSADESREDIGAENIIMDRGERENRKGTADKTGDKTGRESGSESRNVVADEIRMDSVILELEDTENTLERAMFHFSFLEKKTERIGEQGRFQITLYYPKVDEKEVLIRILSFGHQIRVILDGFIRDEIERRIRVQMELFRASPRGSA